MLDSEAAFVTTIPVAVEMRSAGICVTNPSPTVSKVYVDITSLRSIFIVVNPTIIPPIIFIIVMIIPTMASPFTNLLAPSMAP